MGLMDSLTQWWHDKTAKTDEATQEPEPDAPVVGTPPTVDSEPASAEQARSGNDAYEPHELEEFGDPAREASQREADK